MNKELKQSGTDVESDIETGKVKKYDPIEAGLNELREAFQGKTWDLTTTQGNREARSARELHVKLRGRLEKTRKALKAPALEYAKRIDSEAKRIEAAIRETEDAIDSQIKADESRREMERKEQQRLEEERVAGIRRSIAALAHAERIPHCSKATAATLERWLEELGRVSIEDVPEAFKHEALALIEANKTMIATYLDLTRAREEAEAKARKLEAELEAERETRRTEAPPITGNPIVTQLQSDPEPQEEWPKSEAERETRRTEAPPITGKPIVTQIQFAPEPQEEWPKSEALPAERHNTSLDRQKTRVDCIVSGNLIADIDPELGTVCMHYANVDRNGPQVTRMIYATFDELEVLATEFLVYINRTAVGQ